MQSQFLHLPEENVGEVLFDLGIAEQAKHPRKNSFVALMDVCSSYFPEYDTAEQLTSMFLLGPELHIPPSDGESTASSLKSEEELELPKAVRRTNKKLRHPATKSLPVPLVTPTVRKQIGLISLEQRQAKIKRFLEKRLRRNWGRKVSYDCRKRVADGRLRVKGRFVAKKTLESEIEEKGEVRKEENWEGDLGELLSGN